MLSLNEFINKEIFGSIDFDPELINFYLKGILMLNLQESLQKYIVQVPFIKKNGEERLMICTLIPDMLPEVKGEKKSIETAITQSK